MMKMMMGSFSRPPMPMPKLTPYSIAIPPQFRSVWDFHRSLDLALARPVPTGGITKKIATGTIAVLILVNVIIYYWSKHSESAAASICSEQPSAQSEAGLCRRFTLSEMEAATQNFSAALILGKGGFGLVYKGVIDNQTVAVKRLKSSSWQGEHEFLMELGTSELRHANLVPLIGYCRQGNEMILVYEYMARGTLADCLYRSLSSQRFSWKQCLKICIGGARGLEYLHTGCGFIHRDVKATNILLDQNLVAKISDFGLAKLYDIHDDQSHVTTNVKGTVGYMDPNYAATGKLTTMSDTYAFGVVLLEVLCGQMVHNPRVDEFKRNITLWGAEEMMSRGEVDLMVSPSLRDEILPESLKAFVDVVEGCLQAKPEKRPTMAQVVVKLESILQQHKSRRSKHVSKQEVKLNIANAAVVKEDPSSELQINGGAVWTPKKSYILSARSISISIIWSNNSRYWQWISHPNSRSQRWRNFRTCAGWRYGEG